MSTGTASVENSLLVFLNFRLPLWWDVAILLCIPHLARETHQDWYMSAPELETKR